MRWVILQHSRKTIQTQMKLGTDTQVSYLRFSSSSSTFSLERKSKVARTDSWVSMRAPSTSEVGIFPEPLSTERIHTCTQGSYMHTYPLYRCVHKCHTKVHTTNWLCPLRHFHSQLLFFFLRTNFKSLYSNPNDVSPRGFCSNIEASLIFK